MRSKTNAKSRKEYHRRGNGVLLTAEELATQLGEEKRSIDTMRRKGILPYYDFGHRFKRFKLDECLAALEKRKIKAVR